MEEEHNTPPDKLPEKADKYFYYENGLMVFTEAYHLLRGYCCERGCRHCPYGFKNLGKSPSPPERD